MRVALVCGDYRPRRDGVADYTARLAAELAARGTDVVIATVRNAEEAGAHFAPASAAAGGRGRAGDVVVTAVAERWDARGVWRAARRLRALALDVVHVQFAPSAFAWSGAVGLLPALLGLRTRLVVTVHEYAWWSWGPRWLTGPLARTRRWDPETALLVPQADAVVATNDAHARAVHARFPLAPVTRIGIGANLRPAPVDRGAARAAVRAALGLPGGAPLLAFFGFVHAVKGTRHLLDGMALVRAEHPDAHLLLVGGFDSLALRGPEATAYRAEVEAMIAARGLASAVTVTGWRPEDEVSRLLAAADLAVLPFTAGTTTKSGSLLACAEHGLPLVTTAADPPDPELVDGETALLVGTRDGDAIEKAVARVLGDPDLAGALAAGARRLAAEHGWHAIADAHLRLYQDVQP